MTLRRIHQNLHSIKNHPHQPIPSHLVNHRQTSPQMYDSQQEPSHPKMFVQQPSQQQSPAKWTNSRIRQDFSRTDGIQAKINTARESKRLSGSISKENGEAGRFTALNSSRVSRKQVHIGPSGNNTPREGNGGLYVPERNKIKQKEKLALFKGSRRENVRNASFSSHNPTPIKSPSISNLLQPTANNQQQELHQSTKKLHLIQPNKTIHHISHLRKYQQEQKQRQTLLNNRLKFITIDNERQNKKLQMTRRKFQKVVSIRSQFLHEKDSLNKIKEVNRRSEMVHKKENVYYVKQQENSRKMSLSRLSQGKSLQASRIRSEEKALEKQRLLNKLAEFNKKKEAVRHTQSSLQKSRERISELNRSRISSIRSLQNKTLVRNYMNVEKRDKQNEKLYQTLQREIKLINERKLKAASQLKEYEEILELNGKRSKEINLMSKNKERVVPPFNKQNLHRGSNAGKLQRAVSSTFSGSGSKSRSFYLTNC